MEVPVNDKIKIRFSYDLIDNSFLKRAFRKPHSGIIEATVIGLIFDNSDYVKEYINSNITERKKIIKKAKFVIEKTKSMDTWLKPSVVEEGRFLFTSPESKKEYEENPISYISIEGFSSNADVLFESDFLNKEVAYLLSDKKEVF